MSSRNFSGVVSHAGQKNFTKWRVGLGICLVVVLILLGIYCSTGVYLLKTVDANKNQIAVVFSQGKIAGVKGPGVYTSLSPYSHLSIVDIGDKRFTAIDDEVITKDRQRVGLKVTGTVRRPGLDKAEFLMGNWTAYSTFYTNDEILVGVWDPKDSNKLLRTGLIQDLAQQAMKVCVGDREFDRAVIGSARDDLRECICEQLDALGQPYGLDIRNVMVPNIVISPEVQKKLDEITDSRLKTDLAKQNELKALAEANQSLAVEQGAIRVEQGKIQEKAKQDAITADLTKKATDAQKQVIESQKTNELLSAQRDFEIQKARRLAKEEEAKANIAEQNALAEMYQLHPEYVSLLKVQSAASALKATDKVYLPIGTDPVMVIGQPVTPLVNIPAK